MKIEGPAKTQKSGKSDKGKKTNTGDNAFGSLVAGASQETSGAAAAQSIAKVDALLTVQGAEDPAERKARKKMKERGDSVLRQLDHLRLGILTGNMTLGQIINLADVVASHRENINDPMMTAVLDEIDLRAQIEIAKARKAMEDAL